jgi:PAS domain S-box-containing protein
MNISATQDIADDLAFRVAIRQSEIRYRRLFEAAHDGVLILDSVSRKITDANPFMSHLLGYPHEELLGRELWEIGLLKDEQASQAAFRVLQKDGQVRYEDLPLESKSGDRREVEVVANRYDETASRSFNATSATSPNESGPKLHCGRATSAFALCSRWFPQRCIPATPRASFRISIRGPRNCGAAHRPVGITANGSAARSGCSVRTAVSCPTTSARWHG